MARSVLLRTLFTSSALVAIAFGRPALAADRAFAINAQAGVLFPGTINVANGASHDLDTKTGLVLRGGADFFLIPKLSLGVFVLNARTSVERPDVDISVLGLGTSLAGHFGNQDRLHARAGLELSYQMDHLDAPNTKDAKGLGLAVFVEAAQPVTREVNLLARLSFVSQPTGGNSDIDLTWAPIVYLSFGVEYSR